MNGCCDATDGDANVHLDVVGILVQLHSAKVVEDTPILSTSEM